MCCNMRILNGTFAPRTRAVTSTWRDMAGNLLAIPEVPASTYPPTCRCIPECTPWNIGWWTALVGRAKRSGEGERTGWSKEEEKGGESFTCVLEIWINRWYVPGLKMASFRERGTGDRVTRAPVSSLANALLNLCESDIASIPRTRRAEDDFSEWTFEEI